MPARGRPLSGARSLGANEGAKGRGFETEAAGGIWIETFDHRRFVLGNREWKLRYGRSPCISQPSKNRNSQREETHRRNFSSRHADNRKFCRGWSKTSRKELRCTRVKAVEMNEGPVKTSSNRRFPHPDPVMQAIISVFRGRQLSKNMYVGRIVGERQPLWRRRRIASSMVRHSLLLRARALISAVIPSRLSVLGRRSEIFAS